MTQHPMRYVAMTERLLSNVPLSKHQRRRLRETTNAIVDAESALVKAYGEWRDVVARLDNGEARHILDQTQSDLT